jgi:hypothetical protein
MRYEDLIDKVRKKYQALLLVLDERSRRVWAAAEAESLGYEGQSIVAVATGISRTTISSELALGKKESTVDSGKKLRLTGGGRKSLTDLEPVILSALKSLVEPTTHGDPESPLRWTCKSTRQIAAALKA